MQPMFATGEFNTYFGAVYRQGKPNSGTGHRGSGRRARFLPLGTIHFLGFGGFLTCGPRLARAIFHFDSLTKIVYGEAFGFLERDEDVYDYMKLSEASIPLAVFGGAVL